MLTVGIPVGPYESCTQWLDECLDSVLPQLRQGDDVLIIDDMSGWFPSAAKYKDYVESNMLEMYSTTWRVGVATAFNFAVMGASNDLVIMLGSDDKLMPNALEACRYAWRKWRNPLGFYYMDLQYSDGETQTLACNAAMVHKDLWRHTGGFAVEASIGAMDSILISIMLAHDGKAGKLYRIPSPSPIYWARRHSAQATATGARYQNYIHELRNNMTLEWVSPDWAKRR